MLFPTGMFDGKAIALMGEVLHLNGLRIVKHENGILAPCDAGVPLPFEHCPMVLHDGYGHFKALIPFRETSGGTHGEESAASGVESETSGGTDEEEEEEEEASLTEGEEFAASDVESGAMADDLGWSLVRKRGRVVSHGSREVARTRFETRPVSSQVSHL